MLLAFKYMAELWKEIIVGLFLYSINSINRLKCQVIWNHRTKNANFAEHAGK